MRKVVFILLILVNSFSLNAHDYYEGLTRIFYNKETSKLEIIHRFATHDMETIVSQIHGSRVNYKQRKYPALVKQYFVKNFSVSKDNKNIELEMIGVEPGEKTTVVYQEVDGVTSLLRLVIKNNLLLDEFPKQLNLLNYQDESTQGTLIFSKGDTTTSIR